MSVQYLVTSQYRGVSSEQLLHILMIEAPRNAFRKCVVDVNCIDENM